MLRRVMQAHDLIGSYDLNDIKISGGVIWVAADNGLYCDPLMEAFRGRFSVLERLDVM
jgi:hypothetical protein